MSLLYHTRWSLSRGFFNFFLTFFRLGEVALPLPCTFIIPHLDHFVKGYFEFFLLCSRHNPSLLQRNGSGSHLYTANLHTLRSGHRELVLHRSRGLRFFPLPSLAFCTLIVSHFKGFVKRFFELFSRNFLGEKHLPLWEFTNPFLFTSLL